MTLLQSSSIDLPLLTNPDNNSTANRTSTLYIYAISGDARNIQIALQVG